MEASSVSVAAARPICRAGTARFPRPGSSLVLGRSAGQRTRGGKLNDRQLRARAVEGVTAVTDPPVAEITWQIIVGAVAGVTPFVVAGIEFSKRIIAQRRCEVCGGSGLVLEEKEYFKCPGCGGFLPWQSWKRFFSG